MIGWRVVSRSFVILDVGMLRVLRYFRMLFRSLRRLLSNLTAIVNIESIPFIIHGLHELDWYEGEMIVKTINEKSWFWLYEHHLLSTSPGAHPIETWEISGVIGKTPLSGE
jgi:hypothetical protein